MKFLKRLFGNEKSSKVKKNSELQTTPFMIPSIKPNPPRVSFHISPLYVILPYFNYCHFQKRTQLFLEFVERYSSTPNIKIVIVEGTPKGTSFQLPEFNDKVYLHIKIELSDRVWIKENMINIAIKNLPQDWYYVAWVDADITFLNDQWAKNTIDLLKTHDVVQMFHSAVNMGPDGETLKVEQSFMYMYVKGGKPFHKTSKYGVWHPGFAWACTRHAYHQMDSLIDFSILGSGDRHMALSFIGKGDLSYPGNIHESYKKKVAAFQHKCKGFKVNYIQGTILHHFHGSLVNRKYVDRWNILIKNKYDIEEDIYYTEHGMIKLTEKGKRMQTEIDTYFLERKEDDTVLVVTK